MNFQFHPSSILGTRGSALARVQTTMVREALQQVAPGLHLAEKIITTTGDAKTDLALYQPVAEGSGLFTRQLEEALLAHAIDAAVHSLKDLPVVMPPGLQLSAILPRAKVTDVFITRNEGGLQALPAGAVIGTSSPRRLEWIKSQRTDLTVNPVRGNVPTRLRKLLVVEEALDGIILARAGLERLGFQLGIVEGKGAFLFEGEVLWVTELTDLLPAPAQGAVAVETRSEENDGEFMRALQGIHHEETARCVTAERLLLQYLGGGCHMALGALATLNPITQELSLRATYVPFPTAPLLKGEATGATPEEVAIGVAAQLGEKLAMI